MKLVAFLIAVLGILNMSAQTFEAFQRELINHNQAEPALEVDFCKWHITASHVIWEAGDGHSVDIHQVTDYLDTKQVYKMNTYGQEYLLEINKDIKSDRYFLKYTPKQDTSWQAIYHCVKRP